MPFTPLTRRTFLRGAGGIALGLPWLEAMADEPQRNKQPATPPRRVGYVYVPNGIYMAMFQPPEVGPNYTMPETLKIMEPFRKQLNFYTGLDGPLSGHSTAGYLTAVDPSKVPGFSFKNSISVDQVIASSPIGQATRYSCLNGAISAMSTNNQLSWSAEGVPQPAETDPQQLFERLFVSDEAQAVNSRSAELARKKRLLDSVLEESKRLQQRLGTVDQKKIEEYLTSVREVEKDLERQKAWVNTPKPKVEKPITAAKAAEGKHRLHLAILALAFQTDSTRVFTYSMGGEAGGAGYPGMISHHGGSHCGDEEFTSNHPAIHRGFIDINQLELKVFADFIARLASMKEGEGTVLDNSCIVYGSAHRMLNHWKDSLPLLSVGSLGGKLKTGEHVCLSRFAIGWEWDSKNRGASYRGRTIGDFHLTILRQLGIEAKSHGWGSKVISEICA